MTPAPPETTVAHTDSVSASVDDAETAPWREELRRSFRDVHGLLAHLDLHEADLPEPVDFDPMFPFLVPRPFVGRMRRGDPHDPLLRQVLPLRAERLAREGLSTDPLEESRFVEGPVLQKYRGRVLLITTGACMVNCRYCFRRSFPYAEHSLSDARLLEVARSLGQRGDVREVILSGGDPWLLADHRLGRILAVLGEQAPSVRTVRFHTRVPIVVPSRVTGSLLDVLRGAPQRVVVVVHANHPHEIDEEVVASLRHLRDVVDAVLNQSVLLRGVNDDAETLGALGEHLLDAGALPYYLHLPDPVAGTGHFDVPLARARRIHDELRASQPGYLVPRLVREVPGADSKTPAERL